MELCYQVSIYINWQKFLGHEGSETSYAKFTSRYMLLFHSKLTHPHKIYFGFPADTLPTVAVLKEGKQVILVLAHLSFWSTSLRLHFTPSRNIIFQQDGKIFTNLQMNLQMKLCMQSGAYRTLSAVAIVQHV